MAPSSSCTATKSSMARRTRSEGSIERKSPVRKVHVLDENGKPKTIEQTRWLIRWRVGRARRSKAIKGSRADAQRELRKQLAAQDDGRYVDPTRQTLDEY